MARRGIAYSRSFEPREALFSSRCVAASTISAVAAVPAPYPVHAGTPCPVCLHPCLGFRLRCDSRGLSPFAIYPCAVVLVFVSRPLDGHGNLVLILY